MIPNGQYGFCRARKNIAGTLYTMGYGKPCSMNNDPIEKKPFFHVLPGVRVFSIASAGCTLRCRYCQNWEISQFTPEQTRNAILPPTAAVENAVKYQSAGVAYTYSEPVNFYEYMYDTAVLAEGKGLKNVIHTSGYINREPLEKLCKYLDAANVDLKGFTGEFYRDVCSAELQPVLDTLKTLKKNHVWIEITNLVVPGYNDNPDDIKKMCLWIRENLGADTPLHFTRFTPMYKLAQLGPTPVATLEKAWGIAHDAGLRYVYIGNVPGDERESTFCPRCGRLLIRRVLFSVLENNVKEGRCAYCLEKIPGIWK